jgi:hypothetical protein
MASRLPVPFRGSPDRFPVLRRRFHDDFLDPLLQQPVGRLSQLGGVAAKLTPLELVLTVDFDVGNDHRQHSFMNVDSCYPVRDSVAPSGGSGERASSYLKQGHGLSLLPPGRPRRPIIRSTRTLRIRHTYGLDLSNAPSISPLPAASILTQSQHGEAVPATVGHLTPSPQRGPHKRMVAWGKL